MFEDVDWSNPAEVENVRRSIAMLGTGQMVLTREEAVPLVDGLLELLRRRRGCSSPAGG